MLKVLRTFVLAVALFGMASSLHAASVCVTGATPAGGCGSTQTTLALALTNAVEGDTIYLHAGQTFTGHWTLPDKSMTTTGITISTDTAVANLPAAGVRATMAHSTFMPILQSDTTSNAVITAARGASSAAERYHFVGIWFKNNPGGYGDVVAFGTNDCDAGFCQEYASQEPDNMSIDRCLFTADPIVGQKRFVEFGGTNLSVTNSSFFGAAAFGQDSQCVGGMNGHGPWTIINNYCEATTENILIGGDDARIRTVMTVAASPAPTTTSATVNVSVGPFNSTVHTMAEVAVGDHLAVLISGGTVRCHTTLRSKSGSGASTIAITFDPCSAAPDSPGDIRAGVTVKNLTIRRNYLTKQLAWLNPIINPPSNVNATASTASGSLAAGTYSYTVVALNTAGYQGQTEYSSSQTVTCTLTATGTCTISWIEPSSGNASHYQVYGRAASGVTQYWQVTAGTATYADTGSAGTAAAAVPKGSYWQLKNLLEIKGAQSVQVDSNVLEYQWAGSDNGGAIWIKSNNQSNGAEFNWSKDIVIEKNIVRHVDGCLIVSGQEPNSGSHADDPGLLTNFTYRNNLCYDSGSQWALAKGGTVGAKEAVALNNSSLNTIIDHNTFIHTANRFVYITSGIHTGLVITNNLALRNTYGIFCDTYGEGMKNGCTRAPTPTITANAIAGISTSIYPTGNFGPTVAAWQAEFTNYTADGSSNANGAADYHLLATSTYIASGTDGLPLGADISAVLTATAGVTTGGAGGSVPPSITTTSLPHGIVSSVYTATISAQGTGAITFATLSGSLPTGLSLASSGAITGTPSGSPGVSSFTVRATDAGTGLTADQALTLTVDPAFTNVSITTTSPITAAVNGQTYDFAIVTAGGQAPFAWSVTSGALPAGLTLNATTGHVSGVPAVVTPAAFTFTATVTGSLGTSASKSLSVTVGQEATSCGRSQKYNNYFQYATFLQPTAPVLGLPDCTRNGDSWMDTSKVPPILNSASVAGGVLTWAPVGAGPSTHLLLSATHTDTVAQTPQEGDLIVFSGGGWQRFPIATGVLTSDGTAVNWQAAAGGASPRAFSFTFFTRTDSAALIWTNMPAAYTEIFNTAGLRQFVNLTGYTQARFWSSKIYVAGASGSRIYVEYSTDQVVWAALDGSADGVPGSLGITVQTPPARTTAPFVITPAARGPVWLRLVGIGGDGVADPSWGNVGLEIE